MPLRLSLHVLSPLCCLLLRTGFALDHIGVRDTPSTAFLTQHSTDGEAVVDIILTAYHALDDAADLSPRNASINKVLTTLTNTMIKPYSASVQASVMEDNRVKQIMSPMWGLLSTAEFEMELWWTQQFLMEMTPGMASLERFWYRRNYVELTQLEVEHFARQSQRPTSESSIVFVGGGPLPLSAVDLHLQTGAKVTIFEADAGAATLATILLHKLGLGSAISVVHKFGQHAEYHDFSHVIIAALVREQTEVAEAVMKTNAHAMIAARSAEGLRRVLYPRADVRGMESLGLTCTGSSETNERIINTLLTFARK